MDKQCESPHLIAANFFFAESLKLIHLSDCRSFPAACPSFADPHLVFVRQVRRQLIRVIDETPLVVCFAKLRGRCILWDFQNLRVRGEESCPCNMLVRGQQRGEQQNSCVGNTTTPAEVHQHTTASVPCPAESRPRTCLTSLVKARPLAVCIGNCRRG